MECIVDWFVLGKGLVYSMSSFRDLVQGGKNEYGQRIKACKPIAESFPFVAEILSGSPSDGENKEVSPGSISFFLDGSQLKFAIYVKSPEQKFFGIIQDIVNPWGSINSALSVGDVSRKRHSEHNGSLDKVPY